MQTEADPIALYACEGRGRMEVIRIVSLIQQKINIIRSGGSCQLNRENRESVIDIQMGRESSFRGFQWRSAQSCSALGEVIVQTKIDTCDNGDLMIITNTNPVYGFYSGSGWVCMYITSKGCMGNLCTLCSILLYTKTCSKKKQKKKQ